MSADAAIIENSVPPSPDHETHRARRHHRAWKTTKAGFVAKTFSLAVRFLTIPLALRLLGPERYGLWLTVSSTILWFGFAGSGFGSGLINSLSREMAESDEPAMRVHISTAVFSLCSMAALIVFGTLLLASWPGLPSLFGLAGRADLELEARHAIIAAGLLFAASFALDFVGPVCAGLQEGHLTSISWISASVGSLIWMLWLARFGGGIISYAAAMGVPSLIANSLLAAYLFTFRHPAIKPSWKLWSRQSFQQQMRFGSWMLLGEVAELAVMQSSNVLIANRFGPAEVPRYAVAAAIFQNIVLLCYGSVYPYWPAIAEARFRQDWVWIRAAVKRTLLISLGLMFAAVVLMVSAGRLFIGIWAGPLAVPPQVLLLWMSVYFLLLAYSNNNRIILLGLGLVRLKVLLTWGVASIQVAGFFLAAPHIGVMALPVAGAVGMAFECLVASTAWFRTLRSHERCSQPDHSFTKMVL